MATNHTKPVRAVFLDRDGTIIEDRGHIGRIEDVSMYPFSAEALRMMQKEFLFFIVTNQSGVGLGKVDGKDVAKVNEHVVSALQSQGVTIRRVYCCGHAKEDNCECIKPKPYFIKKAQTEFNIAVEESYTIGDHPHDVEFGEAAGATGVYVLTGHGRKHLKELPSCVNCFENLHDAARWIMNRLES